MTSRKLSDDEIIEGFRMGNASIIRDYFYGYCLAGYNLFDQKYGLNKKENLDFMSLAHQYALYLMEHNWKPLEDHSPNVSLKTWFIGGFRYVVLDALKWHHKEYGSITFEDYLRTFDADDDLRRQFNGMVEDFCKNASLSTQERTIVDMLLLRGYKIKEVADQLGLTSSAISQKFKQLRENVIVPYFRKNFDLDLDNREVIEKTCEESLYTGAVRSQEEFIINEPFESVSKSSEGLRAFKKIDIYDVNRGFSSERAPRPARRPRRTTPEFITELQPGEIFVFGSNLRGIHAGGAAYAACRRFGAVMGQGVGLQGQSYAIPTMQGGVETIRPYVDEFIDFARQHPELTFLVTRIGCGIAGFTDWQIAPLFEKAHALENVVLPEGWI